MQAGPCRQSKLADIRTWSLCSSPVAFSLECLRVTALGIQTHPDKGWSHVVPWGQLATCALPSPGSTPAQRTLPAASSNTLLDWGSSSVRRTHNLHTDAAVELAVGKWKVLKKWNLGNAKWSGECPGLDGPQAPSC